MPKGKEYSAVDMVSPFTAAFWDWATIDLEEPKLTILHTMYWDLVKYLVLCLYEIGNSWVSS